MAFKMKGSAFKLNEVATKSALKQGKSPIKDSGSEWLNTLNEQGMDTGDSEKAYAKKHDRKHVANNPMDPPHGEPKDTTETEESMRKGAEISGALPMESPMKLQEETDPTEEVVTEETDPTEEVATEEKVNPHPPKTFKHALFQATNQPKDEMLAEMRRRQADLDSGMWDGDPKAIANHKRIIKAQQSILFPGGGMGGF